MADRKIEEDARVAREQQARQIAGGQAAEKGGG
jgi:hypothetical protein